MGVNGRQKGSTFERVVAKEFAVWTKDVVKRTPMSGGWSREKAFDVAGDLVFTRVKTLHVECKKQEGWALEDLLIGVNKNKVRSWWRQCTRECPKDASGRYAKLPLLVFARNRVAPLVMLPWERDMLAWGLSTGGLEHNMPTPKARIFEFSYWRTQIVLLSAFLLRYRCVV